MHEVNIQMTATSLTMFRQLLAFLVDMGLMSLPVWIHPCIETVIWFMLVWFLYIPLAEYFYGRTLGMVLLKTRIFGFDGVKVPWSAVSRRHVARISMLWGVLGWLTLITQFRIAEGYIIMHDSETPQRKDKYVFD